MTDESFTIADARLVTMAVPEAPRGPRRGHWRADLGIVERGWVRIRGGAIEAVGAGAAPTGAGATRSVGGRVLMPGFVDCHTHACWVGQRYDEIDRRLAGASYLDILRAGGGIMATVRAVRAASIEALASATGRRLDAAARLGTTTIEVKSGYGLTPESELAMLEAILRAARFDRPHVVPAFLGGHAKDPQRPTVEEMIEVALPEVARRYPGIVCDAYCEEGAWSVEETTRLLRSARDLGCRLRVHADQFHALGMTQRAIELGAVSVDHLEASGEAELAALASSDTVGVGLPGCGFHLDGRYAPLRRLADLGGAIAIASNCNPGSSPTISMPFIVALAVRYLRLTLGEALVAATVNAAHVLGLGEVTGILAPGRRADLQLLASDDERSLAYEYAAPGPDEVWIAGRPLGGLARI